MTYPIPTEALDDRLGVLGTAGSGKTYSVLGAFARLLKRGSRAIAFDALGVMYGIRLAPDGGSPSSFKPVIFGGPHGDLPLTVGAASLIGETIATMAESVILDLSEIGSKSAERRFMLGVLQALYKHADKEPVHLLFDEADLWAPQKVFDKEGEAYKLLGMMEQIVRRGRIKGFIPWLITQRPAVLSKDVLSQADGIVAMKLTASQDRDAIGAWIEGQADRAKGKEILALLPTMNQGEGVIWIPGRSILKTATFPKNATYDSSRTPKRGESVRKVDLKPLDLGKLKDRLAHVEQEAKANDPAALKALVARMTAELAKAKRVPPKAEDAAAIRASAFSVTAKADAKALAAARAEGAQTVLDGLPAILDEQHRASFAAGVSKAAEKIKELSAELFLNPGALVIPRKPLPKGLIPTLKAAALPSSIIATPAMQAAVREAPGRIVTLAPTPRLSGDGGGLKGPLQKIVDAIRWWNLLGVADPGQPAVAFLAGYSHKSGTWSDYLSRLRSSGMIEGKGNLTLTAEGEAAARDPKDRPTASAARAAVIAYLKGPLQKIMAPILEAYPNAITQAEVAAAAGYSPASGTWSDYLSRCRSQDLIEGRGELRAKDWLFPGGF